LRQDYTTARIDHLLGTKDTVYWRFTNGQAWNSFASVFPDPVVDTRAKVQRTSTPTRSAVGFIVSAHLINDVHYTFGKRYFHATYAGVGSNKNKELGVAVWNPAVFSRYG